MSTIRNKVLLIGRIGNEPEVKTFESDKKVVRFNLATNENYTNSEGEKAQKTTWHTIIAWGNLVSFTETHVKKGKQVAVDGKLTYREFTNKEGLTKSVTEIVANEILLL